MYQKIRTGLFYLSIAVFFVCVPLTLIFSLGYDITWGKLKFSRAGLVAVNSKPEGAAVYLNHKNTGQTTPAVLKELKPGVYHLKLQLAGFYPWQNQVTVEEGRVTDFKEIILFKRIPSLEKLNMEEVADFALDKNRDNAFFIAKENNAVYKIDIKAKISRLVYQLLYPVEKIKKWLISPDGNKILYAAGNKIYVGFLFGSDSELPLSGDFAIAPPEEISDVFWHIDGEHIIVVTVKDIKVFELFSQGKNNIVTLAALNFRRPKVFYDAENNSLYFTDLQETSQGKYHNLYKIQLGKRQGFPIIEELENK